MSLHTQGEPVSETDFIVDQLKRAFDGEAWHGPALMEILDGVDAGTAAAHPIANAHSIWELVLHLAAWERVVARRLEGQPSTLSDDENFGHAGKPTEAAWRDALHTLRTSHNELIKAASALTDSQLNNRVPGKDYDVGFMLTGAVQHAAYHGGQIAVLKRARE
jgi:uncharacterized damage-inducible protein DinB